ncbi:MAG: aminopeptidase P family protein [Pseudomonadota bacterium]
MFQTFYVTTRPETAAPRVADLRAWMKENGLDAFLVPRADAYQGEYVAPSDERLSWLTGFTGSAGFAVILSERAAIFTDGRYTLQVKAQTDGDLFETVDWPRTKLRDWLPDALPDGGRVGFDPWLHSVSELDGLKDLDGIEMVPSKNGVDAIWAERPAPPAEPMSEYPTELAGRNHNEKRIEIAKALQAKDLSAFVTNQPDALAWLLNIRGADIDRTPIAQAYGIIHADGSVNLFCDPEKAKPVSKHLGEYVRVNRPKDLIRHLGELDGPVGYHAASCPVALAEALQDGRKTADPIALPKARKTTAEIEATREAHLRDATAMVRFLRWLDEDRPEDVTEIGVVKALEQFRRDTNALRDISFETIAGSGPNGAIVHYRVNEETDRPLAGDPVILVDSGGQYLDGTTDITRTVPLVPEPPEEIAHAFTRVLQGMIAISRVRFPKGVAGAHLDALARAPLWMEHRDYDHGTGHGVGVYLGVHEGPARLSRVSEVPLEAGMILSNEPGYYREGAWGIRIENLIVAREAERPDGGDDREMLDFETLTWVPVDRRLIKADLLAPAERDWVDAYHAEVLARLTPRLEEADLRWLQAMCAPL